MLKNQRNATRSMEANKPVSRNDSLVTMEPCEKNPIAELQMRLGTELKIINEKDKEIIVIDDSPINERGKVILVSEDETTPEPINNVARSKCTKDGVWLISGSDDDSSIAKKNANVPASSRTRPEDVCWKCKKGGTLLICSRSLCDHAKVHKECLNCQVNVDEHGNFVCPSCWYILLTADSLESQRLQRSAKEKLAKLFSRCKERLTSDLLRVIDNQY